MTSPGKAVQRLGQTGLCFAVAYAIWLWKNRRRLRALFALPGSSVGLAGDLFDILRVSRTIRLHTGPTFLDIFTTYFVKKGDAYREEGLCATHVGHPLLPFSRSVILVTDLDITRQVLGQKAYGNFRKGWSYRVAQPLVGHGLLSADDGDEWRLMRDLTAAGFRVKTLERAAETVARITSLLVRRWRERLGEKGPECLEVYEDSLRLTMDVLGFVAFSYDFGSVAAARKEDAPLYEAFQVILSTLTVRGQSEAPAWWGYLPTPTNLRFDAAIARLSAVTSQLIAERRNSRAGHGDASPASVAPANDILEGLLARDAAGQPRLSDARVGDCLRTLLFAGHDTTASALTWALHLLARHQPWQDRLRKSLLAAGIGPDPEVDLPEPLKFGRLDELQELTAVVKETLRLVPSAGLTREAVQPTVLRTSRGLEYEVCPGIELFFFPNFLHMDEQYRPEDPLQFRPERWLGGDASEASGARSAAFFPFGMGPRYCVGERLAMLELRVSLALLIANFRFEVPQGAEEPFQVLLLSLQPYGVRLAVTDLTR